jgi:hypothetical protein
VLDFSHLPLDVSVAGKVGKVWVRMRARRGSGRARG